MKDIGKVENKMVKENLQLKINLKLKVFGQMV
jgi:hypothetical protein